jgi:type I restriction enzyme S subunit
LVVFRAFRLVLTSKHVIAVTLDRTIVEPSFASYMLNYHPKYRESIFSQAQGSAQPSLNQSKVCALALPLPSLREQRRIIEYLDGAQVQVAELKRLQAASAAELNRLSGAVLARAFRGEL